MPVEVRRLQSCGILPHGNQVLGIYHGILRLHALFLQISEFTIGQIFRNLSVDGKAAIRPSQIQLLLGQRRQEPDFNLGQHQMPEIGQADVRARDMQGIQKGIINRLVGAAV